MVLRRLRGDDHLHLAKSVAEVVLVETPMQNGDTTHRNRYPQLALSGRLPTKPKQCLSSEVDLELRVGMGTATCSHVIRQDSAYSRTPRDLLARCSWSFAPLPSYRHCRLSGRVATAYEMRAGASNGRLGPGYGPFIHIQSSSSPRT